MTRPVRMLALVAIAASGLLALKSLSLTSGVASLFDPASPAWAASESHKTRKNKNKEAEKTKKETQHANNNAAQNETPAEAGAPACEAPDAAEQAGLSEEELNVYMTLAKRAKLLDERDSEIATREGLLTVSQQKIETRIARLEALKNDIATMLGQLDEKDKAQILALTKLYDTMKPKPAAKIFSGLDKTVLLEVASRMKADNLAKVMAAMAPDKAGALTIALAEHHALPKTADQLPGLSKPVN